MTHNHPHDFTKTLKDEYERYEASPDARESFVKHLRDVADFTGSAWVKEGSPTLPGLPVSANTLNHSVTIAPMVRFFSRALWVEEGEKPKTISELEGAIKAIAAFSALWRASRRGTANIDQQYREILAGNNEKTTKMPALARSLKKQAPEGASAPAVDLDALKAELRARLAHAEHGGIDTRDKFVREAYMLPAYLNSREVTRFILLAAYHDSVADPSSNGLIVKGKVAVSPSLTFDGFRDERNFSLEHIAPKDQVFGWDAQFYETKEITNRLGNLVLVPQVANSSLSARPWREKRVMYSALGANSHADAERILAHAKDNDAIEFGESTVEIINSSKHLPQVAAIGERDAEWSVDFIEERSKRLLGLAMGRTFQMA
jgi:hypothetical protein